MHCRRSISATADGSRLAVERVGVSSSSATLPPAWAAGLYEHLITGEIGERKVTTDEFGKQKIMDDYEFKEVDRVEEKLRFAFDTEFTDGIIAPQGNGKVVKTLLKREASTIQTVQVFSNCAVPEPCGRCRPIGRLAQDQIRSLPGGRICRAQVEKSAQSKHDLRCFPP